MLSWEACMDFFLSVYLSNKYYDTKILFPMNSLFRLSIMCELWFHGFVLIKVADFFIIIYLSGRELY